MLNEVKHLLKPFLPLLGVYPERDPSLRYRFVQNDKRRMIQSQGEIKMSF